jgi:hypothetical protein
VQSCVIAVSAGCLFCYDCPYPWALRHHTIKFQEVILLMAIIGIFLAATPAIPKISQK